MEIEPAENGGFTVTHHMKESPKMSPKMGMSMGYVEPEKHVFGKGEGAKLMAHITSHLGVK